MALPKGSAFGCLQTVTSEFAVPGQTGTAIAECARLGSGYAHKKGRDVRP